MVRKLDVLDTDLTPDEQKLIRRFLDNPTDDADAGTLARVQDVLRRWFVTQGLMADAADTDDPPAPPSPGQRPGNDGERRSRK
jgi:hypothetical protein